MTKHTIAPTILAGAEIRKIREAAGKKMHEVIALTGHSMSHLSRMETGRTAISPVDAASILTACAASPEDRQKVMKMIQDATDDPSVVRNDLKPESEGAFPMLECVERDATSISQLAMLMIPGRLQTADYTRALMEEGLVEPERIEALVERKQSRQTAFYAKSRLKCTIVIDEGALRVFGSEDVMADQLDRILQLTEQGKIDLRIIPAGRGHAGYHGSYTLMEFNGSGPIVYVETWMGSFFLDSAYAVSRYTKLSEAMLKAALSSPESVNFLHDRVAKLRGR